MISPLHGGTKQCLAFHSLTVIEIHYKLNRFGFSAQSSEVALTALEVTSSERLPQQSASRSCMDIASDITFK